MKKSSDFSVLLVMPFESDNVFCAALHFLIANHAIRIKLFSAQYLRRSFFSLYRYSIMLSCMKAHTSYRLSHTTSRSTGNNYREGPTEMQYFQNCSPLLSYHCRSFICSLFDFQEWQRKGFSFWMTALTSAWALLYFLLPVQYGASRFYLRPRNISLVVSFLS